MYQKLSRMSTGLVGNINIKKYESDGHATISLKFKTKMYVENGKLCPRL